MCNFILKELWSDRICFANKVGSIAQDVLLKLFFHSIVRVDCLTDNEIKKYDSSDCYHEEPHNPEEVAVGSAQVLHIGDDAAVSGGHSQHDEKIGN